MWGGLCIRPIDASYSTDLKNMVSLLLRPSPEERPSAEEIEAMPIVRVSVGVEVGVVGVAVGSL